MDNQPRWYEFGIKGSGGNLRMWHLVTSEAKGFRSACGRLLTGKPERTSEKVPDEIRGVCRRCTVNSRKAR